MKSNAFNESSVEIINEAVDMSLREKPRFPCTPAEWECSPSLPNPVRCYLVGERAFDQMVNRKSRRPAARTVARLFEKFKTEFVDAGTALDPFQWRLLYYLDQYPLAALSDPHFDPRDGFERIFRQDLWFNEVPLEWLGTTTSVAQMLEKLHIVFIELSVDQAKAVWSILALARSLGFGKHEVLQVPWWRSWWLEGYFAATNSKQRKHRKPELLVTDEEI